MNDDRSDEHLREFTPMLSDVLGDRLNDSSTFWTMLGENAVLELPYANPPQQFEGRDAIRAHVRNNTARAFSIDHAETTSRHSCDNGAVTIIEFDLTGKWLSSGAPFEQHCVGFVTVEDGFITRYREYFNPLLARANPDHLENTGG